MSTALETFSTQIENFLLLLTQKERFVVERRFNLDKKEKATLEEIGQHYSVTRERIRQIEKNALSKLKRNLENNSLVIISNYANELIIKAGGVIKEETLICKLLEANREYSYESLQLILAIDKRFNRIANTVNFYPYLKLVSLAQADLENICRLSVEILKKNKNTMSTTAIIKSLISYKIGSVNETMFNSLIQISKRIKYINSEIIGLVDWRHINPRTLRDKIYFVLRDSNQPLHFVDIANKIIKHNFDKKKINLQAVHNELIRHDDFILIGRGIYGLKEWGYSAGTVADVITSLLKNKESLSQDEIIMEVLKQRKVKPITIILSLKNKKQFVRIGRKQYALKKS